MNQDFEPQYKFYCLPILVTSEDAPDAGVQPLHYFLHGYFRHREKLASGLAGDVYKNANLTDAIH